MDFFDDELIGDIVLTLLILALVFFALARYEQ